MTKEKEDVSIERLTQVAVDFCSYHDRAAFTHFISNQVFLTDSFQKKIAILEKMIKAREKSLKMISGWEQYTKKNIQNALGNLLEGRKLALKKKDFSAEKDVERKALLNYCRELYQLIQQFAASLDELKKNEIPESKKPYRIAQSRFTQLKDLLSKGKKRLQLQIPKIKKRYEVISWLIWDKFGDIEGDIQGLFEWFIEEFKKEPIKRTGLSDVDGQLYLNPITYFIDNAIYNLKDIEDKLTDAIEEVERDSLASLLPIGELIEILNAVKSINEIDILNNRISALTAASTRANKL